MTTFMQEVKEEVGPTLCKIGHFIKDQNKDELREAGKEPLTQDALVQAAQKFPQKGVIGALRKRGLKVSDSLLRKHLSQQCDCHLGEVD